MVGVYFCLGQREGEVFYAVIQWLHAVAPTPQLPEVTGDKHRIVRIALLSGKLLNVDTHVATVVPTHMLPWHTVYIIVSTIRHPDSFFWPIVCPNNLHLFVSLSSVILIQPRAFCFSSIWIPHRKGHFNTKRFLTSPIFLAVHVTSENLNRSESKVSPRGTTVYASNQLQFVLHKAAGPAMLPGVLLGHQLVTRVGFFQGSNPTTYLICWTFKYKRTRKNVFVQPKPSLVFVPSTPGFKSLSRTLRTFF